MLGHLSICSRLRDPYDPSMPTPSPYWRSPVYDHFSFDGLHGEEGAEQHIFKCLKYVMRPSLIHQTLTIPRCHRTVYRHSGNEGTANLARHLNTCTFAHAADVFPTASDYTILVDMLDYYETHPLPEP